MKANIRFLCFLTLFVLLFTGCSAIEGNDLYPVSLVQSSDASSMIASDVEVINPSATTETDKLPAKQTMEITFANTPALLQYSATIGRYHVYTTADETARVMFNAESGKIYRLILDSPLSKTALNCDSYSHFVDSVKQIISEYSDEDWEQYEISCKTGILQKGDKATYTQEYDGICFPDHEGQSLSSHSLIFSKKISGFETKDKIIVKYRIYSDSLFIQFSPHQFDNVETLSIDQTLIERSIASFISQCDWHELYVLKDYEIQEPVVTKEGDNLFYMCRIELHFTVSPDGAESFETINCIDISVDITP